MIDALQKALETLSAMTVSISPFDTQDQMRSKFIDHARQQIKTIRPILRHLDPEFADQVRAFSRDAEACVTAAKTGRPINEAAGRRVFGSIETLSNQMADQVEAALIKTEKTA